MLLLSEYKGYAKLVLMKCLRDSLIDSNIKL